MNEKNIIKKACEYFKYAWKEIAVIILIAVFDLVSKNIIDCTMYLGQTVTIIPELFYFTYVRNTRAAYSMSFGLENLFGESGVMTFFIVMTVLAIIVFAFFLVYLRRRMFLFRLSLSMIIGGAFGNLVDRMLWGYVRDFIRLDFFGYSLFGCFNIADMALVFGVILFIFYILFLYDKDDKRIKKEIASDSKTNASFNDIENKTDIVNDIDIGTDLKDDDKN